MNARDHTTLRCSARVLAISQVAKDYRKNISIAIPIINVHRQE